MLFNIMSIHGYLFIPNNGYITTDNIHGKINIGKPTEIVNISNLNVKNIGYCDISNVINIGNPTSTVNITGTVTYTDYNLTQEILN